MKRAYNSYYRKAYSRFRTQASKRGFEAKIPSFKTFKATLIKQREFSASDISAAMTAGEVSKKIIGEIAESERWSRRYQDYLNKRERTERVLEERGFEWYDQSGALTFTEFQSTYLAMKNSLKEEIDAGLRKGYGDINSLLVSNQAYELSGRQTKEGILKYLKKEVDAINESNRNEGLPKISIYQYLESRGMEFDEINKKNINTILIKLREGEFVRENLNLWDMIRDMRQDLFAAGKTKDEVRREVSITFFNSPGKANKGRKRNA